MIRLSPLLLLVAVATSATIESPDAPHVDNPESREDYVMCTTPESCRRYWEEMRSNYDKLFGIGDDDNDDRESLSVDSQDRDRDNRDSIVSRSSSNRDSSVSRSSSNRDSSVSRSSSNEESDQLKMKSSDNDDESNINDKDLFINDYESNINDNDLYIDYYNTDNNGEGGKQNDESNINDKDLYIDDYESIINDNDLYIDDYNTDNNGEGGKQNDGTHSSISPNIPSVANKKIHRNIRSLDKYTDGFVDIDDNNDNHEFGATKLRPHGGYRLVNLWPHVIWHLREGPGVQQIGDWKPRRDLMIPRWPLRKVKCTRKPRPTWIPRFTKTPTSKPCIKYSSWLHVCIRWGTTTPSTGFITTTKPRPTVQFSSTPKGKESTQSSSVPTKEQSTQSSSVPTKGQSTQSSSVPTKEQSTSKVPSTTVESTITEFDFTPVIT